MEKSASPASTLTWLQAAEQVLKEEGPEMHIRELTQRVLELGQVKSSCATSLETLLYRQTSGGVGPGGLASKFVRVPGKHGWFGLRQGESAEEPQPMDIVNSCNTEESLVIVTDTNHNYESRKKPHLVSNNMELGFEPRVFYTSSRKRRHSYPSSDESTSSGSSGEEMGVAGEEDDESCDLSSEDEDDELIDDSVYKKKYEFVKKVAKSMIHDNAALANQITVINKKITTAEEERKFLLNKLVHFERTVKLRPPLPHPQHTPAAPHPRNIERVIATTKAILKSREQGREGPLTAKEVQQSPKTHPPRSSVLKSTVHTTTSERGGSLVVSSANKSPAVPKVRSLLMSGSSGSDLDSESEREGDLKIMSHGVSPPPPPSRKTKVKGQAKKGRRLAPVIKRGNEEEDEGDEQLELAMRSGKVRRLHPIPLKDDGSPVFPIVVGGLKVKDLGKIVYDRPAYHSERYLLPVGFESSRAYPSMKDPTMKCSYTCRILDGGELPIFEMVAEDDPSNPIRAASSTACQTIVLRNINKARDKQATNSGSGPEFFGYSNPTILNLLQKMPDAKKCSKYKFVRFAEPHKRAKRSSSTKSLQKASPSRLNLLKKTLKKSRVQKKKFSPKSFYSRPQGNSGGSTKKMNTSTDSVETFSESSLAIAPVMGTGLQYGMETATMSYSSSDELSSSSENDLVIDS